MFNLVFTSVCTSIVNYYSYGIAKKNINDQKKLRFRLFRCKRDLLDRRF